MNKELVSNEFIKKVVERLPDNAKRYIIENSYTIEDYINDVYYEKYKKAVKMNEQLRYEKKRLRQTKNSWANGSLKEIKNYAMKKSKRGICSIIQAAELLFLSEPKEFHKVFGCDSIVDYGVKLELSINDWCEEESLMLTDFPYFNTRTKLQQQKALEIDVAVIVGTIALNDSSLLDEKFSMKLDYLIDNPYVSDGIGSFKNLKGQTELPYYVHTYKMENKEIVTYIDKAYVDDLKLNNKRVPLYDTKDDHIIATALMKRDIMFYTHKRLTVNIGEVTKAIYKSDNAKNYKAIVDRLIKMAALKFSFIEDGKGLEIRSLFDIKFPDDDDIVNQGNVFLYFSEKFYEKIVSEQVTHIYTKELQKLESPDAVSLAFMLQKERLGITNDTGTVMYSYSYFSEKISFRKGTIKENCKFIERALEELKDKNTIVKSFERVGVNFYITFYPVSQQELQALLKYKEETKKLLSDIQPQGLLN
ncbi:hypothetical protein [Gottfriedia solisilvae]|uniref:Uncharacterized protein n=1 Tax=Gottfriedia solisilvae TaxID=1516104 RepID=A0A8J3F0B3_9BACI|nr:hypothetical protein [Gottfriedia solisilvae]GGI17795.1 hypothetical protein GCM10007380_39720 [Gottfriedia solisilvae]